MYDVLLTSATEKNDFGGSIMRNLKSESHSSSCVVKANKILGMIKRTFTTRRAGVFLKLYKSLVRPHLEYAVPAWSPSLLKDIKLIEGVQKRFTKLVSSNKEEAYNLCRRRFKLDTLEFRRIRCDLIQTFKIIKGYDLVDFAKLFTLSNDTHTRGHSLKICKQHTRINIRKYFFSQKVIDVWNALPQAAIDANSVLAFKTLLGIHLHATLLGLNKPLAFSP